MEAAAASGFFNEPDKMTYFLIGSMSRVESIKNMPRDEITVLISSIVLVAAMSKGVISDLGFKKYLLILPSLAGFVIISVSKCSL